MNFTQLLPTGTVVKGEAFTTASSTPPPPSVPAVNLMSTSDSLANSLDSEKQSVYLGLLH